MLKQYNIKKIDDLFPYVEHSLRTICKTVLYGAQLYSDRLFSDIYVKGLDRIKDFKTKNLDCSLIFGSRHRSHLDYYETQLALGKAGIPTRIQAGDNLFIGPFDPVLRETGAFMAIRDERGFYSKKWLLNLIYSYLPQKMGPYNKEYEIYIDKKLSKLLYEGYLKHILSKSEHSNDILIYPEYVRYNGNIKYGRSYSGNLLDFSPYIFLVLQGINSKINRELFFVPVNISYERVIEDSFMVKIPKLKEKFSRDFVYLKEFAYIATRGLFPFFRRGKCALKFGEPYKMEKTDNKKIAIRDSKMLRNKVGSLETPFSPQIIFYSMNKEPKVNLADLENRVVDNISKLERSSIDVSHLKFNDKIKPLDKMIEETLYFFDAPGRRYTRVKDNSLEIVDNSIVSQYANHIAHLF